MNQKGRFLVLLLLSILSLETALAQSELLKKTIRREQLPTLGYEARPLGCSFHKV